MGAWFSGLSEIVPDAALFNDMKWVGDVKRAVR